jgi:type II secretory pathway pseudopilin PulG
MKRNHGFTLVEMLAVLGIVIIMFSIGIVGVTRLSRATKLQTATTQLYNTIMLARQYAIANRICTAVVFSIEPSNTGTDVAPPYVSYAVATNMYGNNYSATNFGWGYLTRWYKLPDGVVFDFTQGDLRPTGSYLRFNQNVPGTPGLPGTYQYYGLIVRLTDFPGPNAVSSIPQTQIAGHFVFGIGVQGGWNNVYLREGYFDSATGQPVYTPAGVVTDVNFAAIHALWPTGEIKINRK